MGTINCFYDITERQQMEADLRRQTEALAELHRRNDQFLAILSHELRNPLAPILNAVEVLRVQVNQSPFQQQVRLVIERQLAQLMRVDAEKDETIQNLK